MDNKKWIAVRADVGNQLTSNSTSSQGDFLMMVEEFLNEELDPLRLRIGIRFLFKSVSSM